ncbi:hypothetical protein Cgig2_004069 [Carnegiea gigantea]|uniref:DUF6737 domain-containing protein n=1 Tax=Carnegiea gigantea TaxID=171969 RepID=A0A9Q1KSQ6_9CARY|nr:hypothetical protein Cgig2_004069 [Carnegiea gigantea]
MISEFRFQSFQIGLSLEQSLEMGALHHCLSLVSLSSPLQLHLHSPSNKTHLSNSILWSKFRSGSAQSVAFRAKTAKYGSKSRDPIESAFTDENGVVDDMEGYLNSLSLEYDSVWDTKPAWCQPWTIVLTGVSVVACSWIILHSVVVTALASSVIGVWWYIFLYSYPKAYTEMIVERRKRVASGTEDTYGWKKNEL